MGQPIQKLTDDEWYAFVNKPGYYDELRQQMGVVSTAPIHEVSRELFDHMLEVLPPENWVFAPGFESFTMMERSTGDITRQWVRFGARCFTREVDLNREQTFISPALLLTEMAACS